MVIALADGTDMTPLTTLTVDILAIPVEADLLGDFCVPILSSHLLRFGRRIVRRGGFLLSQGDMIGNKSSVDIIPYIQFDGIVIFAKEREDVIEDRIP